MPVKMFRQMLTLNRLQQSNIPDGLYALRLSVRAKSTDMDTLRNTRAKLQVVGWLGLSLLCVVLHPNRSWFPMIYESQEGYTVE